MHSQSIAPILLFYMVWSQNSFFSRCPNPKRRRRPSSAPPLTCSPQHPSSAPPSWCPSEPERLPVTSAGGSALLICAVDQIDQPPSKVIQQQQIVMNSRVLSSTGLPPAPHLAGSTVGGPAPPLPPLMADPRQPLLPRADCCAWLLHHAGLRPRPSPPLVGSALLPSSVPDSLCAGSALHPWRTRREQTGSAPSYLTGGGS